jgi:hypothetical protein
MAASVTIVGSFLAALALFAVASEAAVFTVVNSALHRVDRIGAGGQRAAAEPRRVVADHGPRGHDGGVHLGAHGYLISNCCGEFFFPMDI